MLLTRAPLYQGRSPFSCDLHVLGAPLTFVLSQDQTLQLNLVSLRVVDSGLVELAELGLWLGLEIASFTSGRDGRGGFRVSVTYSSSPRGSLARKRGTLCRAYDSVFKDRGNRWFRGRGRYSSSPAGVRQEPDSDFVVLRDSAAS